MGNMGSMGNMGNMGSMGNMGNMGGLEAMAAMGAMGPMGTMGTMGPMGPMGPMPPIGNMGTMPFSLPSSTPQQQVTHQQLQSQYKSYLDLCVCRQLLTPLFGCYWRNRNNNLLGFPCIHKRPTLDYVSFLEEASKNSNKQGIQLIGSTSASIRSTKGDSLQVLLVLPPTVDPRGVVVLAWLRPVGEIGKPLLSPPLAKTELTSPDNVNDVFKKPKTKEDTSTSTEYTVLLKPQGTWKYDGPVGRTRGKPSYTHPIKQQPLCGVLDYSDTDKNQQHHYNKVVIEIVVQYSLSMNNDAKLSALSLGASASTSSSSSWVRIGHLFSTGFFIGSTRNLRNGVVSGGTSRNPKNKLDNPKKKNPNNKRTQEQRTASQVAAAASNLSALSIVVASIDQDHDGSGDTNPPNVQEPPQKKARHNQPEQPEQPEQQHKQTKKAVYLESTADTLLF